MAERPRVYKTEGIILRRRNIGEADSIFTVFSDREGKFDAVARGVRKPRSRMRGHLEPLTRTRMLLARGRSLDVFTQAETIAPYRFVREDLERGAAALYCAELVDRFTVEHAENPGLYDLLVALLDGLEAGAPLGVVRSFELALLSLTGYDPQLDACAVCGESLPARETLLSPSAGGFACPACRGAAASGRIVSLRAAKVLRYARVASLEDFAALRLDDALAREVQAATADLIRFVLELDPRTRRYVEEIAALPAARFSPPPGVVVE
jgi:DNA repair protein RecO (recombination protein O)